MTVNAGYHTFATGDVLTAAQVQFNLQNQVVMYFADSTARTTALTGVLVEGMVSYLASTKVVEIYTGAAWVSLDDPNAIQNTIVTAKGNIIAASAASTPAALAVGTNLQVLAADSTAATGLKWSACTTSTLTTTGDTAYASAANTLARLPIGTTGQVLTVAAGLPAWATTSSVTGVRKSADQSVSSNTTVANDTHLLFNVAANETFIFQCYVLGYSATAAQGLKATFAGPAGSTVTWGSTNAIYTAAAVASAGVWAVGGTTGDYLIDINNRPLYFSGTIANGATAGQLNFKWSQNTSNATASTVKAGSYIFGMKV